MHAQEAKSDSNNFACLAHRSQESHRHHQESLQHTMQYIFMLDEVSLCSRVDENA